MGHSESSPEKKYIDSNIIIVEDFNTPLSKMENTHSFQVYIFKDRPHDRTQSKPQQVQEN